MILILDTNNSRYDLFQDFEKINWQDMPEETQLIDSLKENINNIDGVIVIQGEGSFSKTREGVVIANMHASLKNTPIVSIDSSDLTQIKEAFQKILNNESDYPLKPDYFAEPNIG